MNKRMNETAGEVIKEVLNKKKERDCFFHL